MAVVRLTGEHCPCYSPSLSSHLVVESDHFRGGHSRHQNCLSKDASVRHPMTTVEAWLAVLTVLIVCIAICTDVIAVYLVLAIWR